MRLTAGAVARARQQPPRPDEPSPASEGIVPLPEPFDARPAAGPSSPRPTSPTEFIQAAVERVETLTARRDELCEELEQVEQELVQWEAITKAIATVPQHYRGRDASRPPQPTGASSPFPEPSLDLPPPAVEEPAPPGSAAGPFEAPAPSPGSPFDLDAPGTG